MNNFILPDSMQTGSAKKKKSKIMQHPKARDPSVVSTTTTATTTSSSLSKCHSSGWRLLLVFLSLLVCLIHGGTVDVDDNNTLSSSSSSSLSSSLVVVLVKVGGSSITDKGQVETLNETAVAWLVQSLKKNLHPSFLAPIDRDDDYDHEMAEVKCEEPDPLLTSCCVPLPSPLRSLHNQIPQDEYPMNRRCCMAFILVHGAGSFGHFHAKQYGLKGVSSPIQRSASDADVTLQITQQQQQQQRRLAHGLAQTRRSVQKLNQRLVSALVDAGINAISISPGFAFTATTTTTTTTGGSDDGSLHEYGAAAAADALRHQVHTALRAGLIPVLHGDAGLFHGGYHPGILSGDTLVELLADGQVQDRVVFLTDVAGVYTDDPKRNDQAVLLPWIQVQSSKAGSGGGAAAAAEITLPPNIMTTAPHHHQQEKQQQAFWGAQESTHVHDVTGGLATKLQSAIAIVKDNSNSLLNVTIAKFGSPSAQLLLQQPNLNQYYSNVLEGTVLYFLPQKT